MELRYQCRFESEPTFHGDIAKGPAALAVPALVKYHSHLMLASEIRTM